MKILEEIVRLWWIRAGVELENPKSEKSLSALREVLEEDLELEDDNVEYFMNRFLGESADEIEDYSEDEEYISVGDSLYVKKEDEGNEDADKYIRDDDTGEYEKVDTSVDSKEDGSEFSEDEREQMLTQLEKDAVENDSEEEVDDTEDSDEKDT